jgi:hypothetical protein
LRHLTSGAQDEVIVADCHYHPDRHGIGVCMRCGRVICAECTTRLDGINHCHGCLEVLSVRPAPPSHAPRGGQWTIFFLSWLGLVGLLWLARSQLAP